MQHMRSDYETAIDNCNLISIRIRQTVLDMLYATHGPHIGSSFSIVELLVALYFRCLKVSPAHPFHPERDRFILSKGHACPALYAVLAERGFLSKRELDGFAVNGGLLEQHPRMDIKRGVELSAGSLGHGLSVGCGMALAAKNDARKHKIYVLLGDGELNEGSVWEAAMFAAHHGLDNLVAIVDYNKIQALGYTKEILDLEPLSNKWEAFGWVVKEINGHDLRQIFDAFDSVPLLEARPSIIIAHTVKGKGVSFMEDELLWHYRPPNDEEYRSALEELFL